MNEHVKAHPIVEFKAQLDVRETEFKAALPAHIPPERFSRVVMTAVQNNPNLLNADRRSLWTSAMKCAQDGLLPDGREAALVIYGTQVQYMPMIAGIRKKVRNSGEITTWDAQVVYENDAFEFELGDDPFIRHKPALGDRGKPIAAYSIAVLKGGEKSREVMSIGEIDGIRARSKSKDKGPWVTDYAEMCRKTVARRHSKVLPMSTDLDDLIRRDDALYDFGKDKEGATAVSHAPQSRSLAGRLDAIASPVLAHDPVTGEVEDTGAQDSFEHTSQETGESITDKATEGTEASVAPEDEGDDPDDTLLDQARARAVQGRKKLDNWYGSLSPADQAALKGDMPGLLATAKASDGRA